MTTPNLHDSHHPLPHPTQATRIRDTLNGCRHVGDVLPKLQIILSTRCRKATRVRRVGDQAMWLKRIPEILIEHKRFHTLGLPTAIVFWRLKVNSSSQNWSNWLHLLTSCNQIQRWWIGLFLLELSSMYLSQQHRLFNQRRWEWLREHVLKALSNSHSRVTNSITLDRLALLSQQRSVLSRHLQRLVREETLVGRRMRWRGEGAYIIHQAAGPGVCQCETLLNDGCGGGCFRSRKNARNLIIWVEWVTVFVAAF